MTSEIAFLPYLRRGLARALTTADPLAGPLPGDAGVVAWIDVQSQRLERSVRLRGPGAVTALAPAQVIRQEPQPDATRIEPNYFPLVEFRAPDLPWLLTPAAPSRKDQLRPWLVLVAVREQEGVAVEQRAGTPLRVLSIGAPAVPSDELPDLADSWAWTHVQSLVPADDIAGAVAADSGDVIARLVCPRRLQPEASYVACLVPAFESGRLTGLGQAPPTGTELAPAWTDTTLGDSLELPVYLDWRFTTGESGDFESLCRRLSPDAGGAAIGLHPLDVTAPGMVDPASEVVVLDAEGALMSAQADPRAWPETAKAAFQGELVPLLDAGITRADFDPQITDPVVAPPTYGSFAAGVKALPSAGWVRALNANPVRRATAGLGARVVRANQEELVAAAWEQAGELQTTTALLNRGRLAAEALRSLAARASTLGDSDLLRFTTRLHPLLPGGSESISSTLRASPVPAGLVSQGMLRLTRPGTPLARDFAERARSASARIGAEHVATTIAATGSKAGSARAALTFADHGLPRGAQTDDPTLDQQVVTSWPVVTAPARLGEGMRRVLERYGAAPGRQPAVGRQRSRIVVGPQRPPSIPPRGQDVSRIADEVRRRLDPQGAVRLALLERIPGLDGALGTNALPTRIPLGPVFDDALAPDLVAVGGDWLVPGLSALGANRVSLVDVNPTFVGAFLIGANDGLARELLWRGYPVDMRATFFHRFWQYVDPTRTDIGDVATQWRLGSSIEDNVKSEPGAMTAIVVRGDLVRRYPTAHWFLQRAARGEDGQLVPVAGTVAEVAFLVVVDRQTAVYGFDVATAAVRGEDGGDGYFVGVEEQVAGPRFGLDVAKPAQFTRKPASWDQLGWGHLVASEQELDDLTHATATGTRIDGLQLQGATWGRNSAHQARATWQRPFRMLIHADQFLG